MIRPVDGAQFDALGQTYESQRRPPLDLCLAAEFIQHQMVLLPAAELYRTCFHSPQQQRGYLRPRNWVPGTWTLDWGIYNTP